MSRITVGCLMAALAIVLCFGFHAAWGQENPRPNPSEVKKAVPATQPKSEAGPGLPAPRLIAIELLIAEVAPKKNEGGKAALAERELDLRELTGPMERVLARFEALRKGGTVGGFRRIHLSAVEEQPVTVMIGESKPYVTGLNVMANGLVSRSVSYRTTGTTLKILARLLTPHPQVFLDLSIDDGRLHVPEDGIPLGTDENGKPVMATEFLTSKLDSKLTVASGQATAALAMQTTAKSGQEQTLVIVGARIVEPETRPEKK